MVPYVDSGGASRQHSNRTFLTGTEFMCHQKEHKAEPDHCREIMHQVSLIGGALDQPRVARKRNSSSASFRRMYGRRSRRHISTEGPLTIPNKRKVLSQYYAVWRTESSTIVQLCIEGSGDSFGRFTTSSDDLLKAVLNECERQFINENQVGCSSQDPRSLPLFM